MYKLLKSLFITVFILSVALVSCSSASNIATLGNNGIYVASTTTGPNQYIIFVDLKPTHSIASGDYDVDLYQKGVFRATALITFTKAEINARADTKVFFPATADEYNTYLNKNISSIFSVKVHNLTQQQIQDMQQ